MHWLRYHAARFSKPPFLDSCSCTTAPLVPACRSSLMQYVYQARVVMAASTAATILTSTLSASKVPVIAYAHPSPAHSTWALTHHQSQCGHVGTSLADLHTLPDKPVDSWRHDCSTDSHTSQLGPDGHCLNLHTCIQGQSLHCKAGSGWRILCEVFCCTQTLVSYVPDAEHHVRLDASAFLPTM